MKVNRKKFIEALYFASLGVASRYETLEQSNCIIFAGSDLITFNDEIMTRSPSPLPEAITLAVLANELIKVVEGMPDDELEVNSTDTEMVIKGKRRSAGITAQAEINLPYDAVPAPGKWSKLAEEVSGHLQQAARTCGRNANEELSTMVHVSPDLVEACDNWRFYRASISTGFQDEILVPGASLLRLGKLKMKRVSISDGWIHFRTGAKQIVSVRCSYEPYHTELDQLLEMDGATEVKFPPNLNETITRTAIMIDAQDDPYVRVQLEDRQFVMEARKDVGWYRETRKIKYDGPDMIFDVQPVFLTEILQRARTVLIIPEVKMKMEAEGIQFVVALNKGS